MTGVEHFATVAHRLIDQLRPKETEMTSTTDLAIRGLGDHRDHRWQCANHPGRNGAWLMPDETWRCDPCHDEPIVTGWQKATADHECPQCSGQIRAGDRVAVLDAAPKQRVCVDCTDAA